jgi:hypothetical protein
MAQTAFAFDLPATERATPSPSDAGFQIGWDHARHGLLPPPQHLLPGNPVREGWSAGRACFGQRTMRAHAATGSWLQLRLQAWTSGHRFEEVQVTPHFLAQLGTPVCPVTRQLLDPSTQPGHIDRVRLDAAFAAGNLAMLSGAAWQARAARPWQQAMAQAEAAAHHADRLSEGLSAAQWRRLAVLSAMVTPLPHPVAAGLPLCVLPPNRLRLLNPIQGLQALVTLQLTHADWRQRIGKLTGLLKDPVLRRDFHLFFHSLLARTWEGGRALGERELRERLEDAWCEPQVLRRWYRFAAQLDAGRTQALVEQAAAIGLAGRMQRVQVHGSAQATEGWALDTEGLDRPAAPRGPVGPARTNCYPAPNHTLPLQAAPRSPRHHASQRPLLS